jgi:predicted transcriptional regulator
MKRFSIHLEDDTLERLKEIADEKETTTVGLIRMVLNRFIGSVQSQAGEDAQGTEGERP